MSVDFSHLSVTTAQIIDAYVARGGQPTDEMLLEAFRRLDPAPLTGDDRQAIHRVLRRDRGRPTRVGQDRESLARRILAIDRNDVPENFRRAIADRITTGRGLSEYRRAISFHRAMETRKRNSLIRGLYRLIKKQVDEGAMVDILHVGSFSVRSDGRPASERALELTHRIMSERLAMYPPGIRRMMNIVAENGRTLCE